MGCAPQGAGFDQPPGAPHLGVIVAASPRGDAAPRKPQVSGACDAFPMLTAHYRWRYPDRTPLDPGFLAAVEAHGGSSLVAMVLARRGVVEGDVDAYFGPPALGLHDAGMLPDAAVVVARVARARDRGERVLVVGDFDADGLTGIAILVTALRRLGLDVAFHVPSRVDEGHGLSLQAVAAARDAGRSLLLTVDTGSSSVAEVAAAGRDGIDVIVTDHHRVPEVAPAALALVNPHRPDSAYPDGRLAGSGVALKVAALLLEQLAEIPAAVTAAELADLAAIGTVADVAPILGENRSIARLGLERLRAAPRPGIAALLASARVDPASITLETIAFVIAPRLNAAGRMGEAADAAALLLAETADDAVAAAATLESANATRRDVTRSAVAEARAILAGEDADLPATLVRGPWPVGIVGLVAARLAEERGRPAVVAAELDGVLRASCRAPDGYDLAGTLTACADLLVRHGGHRGAAGFEVRAELWDDFRARFLELVGAGGPIDPRPELILDLALPARGADYRLLQHLAALAPTGPGNPEPLVGVHGLTVTRIRAAAGGHAQLTLRRDIDVVDAIAFERGDLAETVHEGDRIDVVGRLGSRRFGGFESLQLVVLDVAPARDLPTPVPDLQAPAVAG
jgi:single-stranded-DNA-specific exonuclease